LHVGLLLNQDQAGLRGGSIFSSGDVNLNKVFELDTFLIPVSVFNEKSFGFEAFEPNPVVDAGRDKHFGSCSLLPFFSMPFKSPDAYAHASSLLSGRRHIPFYTQVEVAVGLGVSIRGGVNPGDLLDFLLGFFGFDLYNDDIKIIRTRPASRKSDRKGNIRD
jgi:hypothetical protein